ncbi:MAG: DUF3850 domain-containing protein [Oscillospiraceae bacterium]|nr:DUF3850 domain-containing protein [Oscillospiraceae bacterium]
MTHDLKLQYKYCDDVLIGVKNFEVRLNDRNYKVGDFIKFIPVDEKGNYKAHPIENYSFRIKYILTHKDFSIGIKKEYCILAIVLYINEVKK